MALKSALALLQELKREVKETAPKPPVVKKVLIEETFGDCSINSSVDFSSPVVSVTDCPYLAEYSQSEYSQSEADVLSVLVKASTPILHSQIVLDMAGRGYSKPAAYKAIAACQSRGWIEHNLTTGYVLTGETNETGGNE